MAPEATWDGVTVAEELLVREWLLLLLELLLILLDCVVVELPLVGMAVACTDADCAAESPCPGLFVNTGGSAEKTLDMATINSTKL